MSGDGHNVSTVDDEVITPIPIDYTPGPASIDIGDGKLWKEILTEGEGLDRPAPGVDVYVNYVGSLTDGTEFDRSSTPFTFTLGKKSVIGGWDIAVATMKKGEKSKIIIHPDLGYGDTGSGAKIPPNATLVFEIELLEWKFEDISVAKDGGIIRKVIVTAPTRYYHPNDGATVKVTFEGFYNGVSFEKRENCEFIVGYGSEIGIPAGVEEGLLKIPELETCELTLKPQYAFGSAGNPELGVPPNAEVKYVITLHKFTKGKEVWSLDGPQKMECAREFKAKGTKFFLEKKYALAAKAYKRIVEFLKMEALLQGEEEEERKELLTVAHLNSSQCHLGLKNFLAARNAAEEALEIQPNNVKGWFRKGVANIGLKEPVAAKGDFLKVLSFEPGNKVAKDKVELANQMIKEDTVKEKNLYARMLGTK